MMNIPESLGGGIVSPEAAKVMKRPEFEGVPKPELIAECVVRILQGRISASSSGLRAVINYYNRMGEYPRLVGALKKIIG